MPFATVICCHIEVYHVILVAVMLLLLLRHDDTTTVTPRYAATPDIRLCHYAIILPLLIIC